MIASAKASPDSGVAPLLKSMFLMPLLGSKHIVPLVRFGQTPRRNTVKSFSVSEYRDVYAKLDHISQSPHPPTQPGHWLSANSAIFECFGQKPFPLLIDPYLSRQPSGTVIIAWYVSVQKQQESSTSI